MTRQISDKTKGIHITFAKPVQIGLGELQDKIKESLGVFVSKSLIIEFFVYYGLYKLHKLPSLNEIIKFKNQREQEA